MHNVVVSPKNTQILFIGEVNNTTSTAILLQLCVNYKGLIAKNCGWRLLQCFNLQQLVAYNY